MKVGVYVGSFNPVHKGHKAIIDYLLNNKYVDIIEIVPTGNYWDKKDLIDIKDRIKMLEFYKTDRIIINKTLNHLEYTYQILRALKSREKELYLIIGSDNLPKFHLWKNFEELLEYKIIVLPRDNMPSFSEIVDFSKQKNFIFVDGFSYKEISSTIIREMIEKGNTTNLSGLLDDEVIKYIREKKLYVR